jgi:HD domain
LVVAALLHDAIEDCEVPKELIAETFGDDVASIVVKVTDDNRPAVSASRGGVVPWFGHRPRLRRCADRRPYVVKS